MFVVSIQPTTAMYAIVFPNKNSFEHFGFAASSVQTNTRNDNYGSIIDEIERLYYLKINNVKFI